MQLGMSGEILVMSPSATIAQHGRARFDFTAEDRQGVTHGQHDHRPYSTRSVGAISREAADSRANCHCLRCHDSVMTEQRHRYVDRRLVRWAHAWAAAASETYETIESISTPESPATEIGRRNVMTMVLVDAVRNVVRGAELALGRDSEIVQRFSDDHPTLKDLRDRFEHYEDYVRGTGIAQRTGKRRNGDPLELEKEGIRISASSGGGPEGHVVTVVVIERDGNNRATRVVYQAPSRIIAVAVRHLARALVDAAGMLDERHLEACEMCAAPEGL